MLFSGATFSIKLIISWASKPNRSKEFMDRRHCSFKVKQVTNRWLFLACLCPLKRWCKFSTPFIRSDEVKQCNIRPNSFDAFKKKYTILFVASSISSFGHSIWLLYKRERCSILFARRKDDFSSSFCKNFDLLIFGEKGN